LKTALFQSKLFIHLLHSTDSAETATKPFGSCLLPAADLAPMMDDAIFKQRNEEDRKHKQRLRNENKDRKKDNRGRRRKTQRKNKKQRAEESGRKGENRERIKRSKTRREAHEIQKYREESSFGQPVHLHHRLRLKAPEKHKGQTRNREQRRETERERTLRFLSLSLKLNRENKEKRRCIREYKLLRGYLGLQKTMVFT